MREYYKNAGKIYYGTWIVKAGESIDESLRRAIKLNGPDRNGMIITIQSEKPLPSAQKIMELWHSLQNEMF